MEVDYKIISEKLIGFLLSDWRDATRDQVYDLSAVDVKKQIASRLANLCYYEDYSVSEIVKLADRRNNQFSFLRYSIDIEELEYMINAKIKNILEEL